MSAGVESLGDSLLHVLVHAEGEVLHVTINRPRVRKPLHEDAHRELAAVLRCGPLAIETTKQVALGTLNWPSLAAAIRKALPAANAMLESRDALEGPRAFPARRPAAWKGH